MFFLLYYIKLFIIYPIKTIEQKLGRINAIIYFENAFYKLEYLTQINLIRKYHIYKF